jgi:hypothetical protein
MGIIGDVKDGWGNYLKALKRRDDVSDPEIETLATERAEICGQCPELKESGLFSFVESIITNSSTGDKTHRRTKVNVDPVTAKKDAKDIYRGYKCGKCGCGFPAIVYAPKKSCPLGKW